MLRCSLGVPYSVFVRWVSRIPSSRITSRVPVYRPVFRDWVDAPQGLDPCVAAMRSEEYARWRCKVDELPSTEREVVLGRLAGWSHMEIAERLGISVNASRTRLHRARRELSRIDGEGHGQHT